MQATASHKAEIEKHHLMEAAYFLRAYLECSDAVQEVIRDALDILADPETDEDDRDMTLNTLADALFPNPHEGKLGLDLEESERMGAAHSTETRAAIEGMDAEEATFAERLRAVMAAQNITQEELAERTGVGQPAISNMLNRECRPQRRTVTRFAEALNVAPADLWPGF